MLDLLLKLIDQCIKLTERREKLNRAFYSDFVAPMMDDFENLHKDYTDSFRRYREMVSNTDAALTDVHPVISAISTDSLFSSNLRSKIVQARPPRFIPSTHNEILDDFINAVLDYISCASTNPIEHYVEVSTFRINRLGISNVARSSLRQGLHTVMKSNLTQKEMKQRALEIIDNIIGQLQTSYHYVLAAYEDLKGALLRPK